QVRLVGDLRKVATACDFLRAFFFVDRQPGEPHDMVACQRQVDGLVKGDTPGTSRFGLSGECRARSEGTEQCERQGLKRHDASPVRACRAPPSRLARSRKLKGNLLNVASRIRVASATHAIR